ncbi:MAG: tRNA 4-thiouridine(8) synthase ThiI [Coriobacteriales bacterium]|nr:tRNA 4-thiouridine(8) synthase ThiI [Coriobacteriales bacterium]
MFEQVCLVHYHEIGLKGKNRPLFERQLIKNIKIKINPIGQCDVDRISGHILVAPKKGTKLEPEKFDVIFNVLLKIPGVVRVSLCSKCARVEEEYFRASYLALTNFGDFETFKVDARRNHTDFEKDSMTLNQEVGEYLCNMCPDKKVKMKNPDRTVHFEVVQGSIYVYSVSERAIGGLPVGVSGKVVSLLSSGIDSPVASFQLMKRGATVCGVHFCGTPISSDASIYLVDEIAQKLQDQFGGMPRVYYIDFGNYQKQIAQSCDSEYRVVLYRRLMFKVACEIAKREKARALVTGESLGQVASQTLTNIQTVDDASNLPVFRPLIGTDKLDIIDTAKKIGTFEISSRPADDCCTLFMPKHPCTHTSIKSCENFEESLEIPTIIYEILENATIKDY